MMGTNSMTLFGLLAFSMPGLAQEAEATLQPQATTSVGLSAPSEGMQDPLDARWLVQKRLLDVGSPKANLQTVLAQLEANPESPLALDLVEWIGALPDGLDVDSVVNRLLNLRMKVRDPRVQTILGEWLRSLEWTSAASGMPLNLGEDLFPNWLAQFWSLGPLGALQDPEPLWTRRAPENDPEVQLKASYSTDWGRDVSWRPIERARRSYTIPGNDQPYQSGGCVFFLSGAKLSAGQGFLELNTQDSARVLWNGKQVFFRKRIGFSTVGDWFRIPLNFREGTNSLLLVTDGTQYIEVGARLLDQDGQPMQVQVPSLNEILALGPVAEASLRGEVQVDPRPELGDGSFESLLKGMRLLALGREDLALAVPEPTDADARNAWMHLRFRALVDADTYLPEEVQRQRLIELEESMEQGDGLGLWPGLMRVGRLLQDDRSIEAQAALMELERYGELRPEWHDMAIWVAGGLDNRGTLAREAMEHAAQVWPEVTDFQENLVADFGQAGNSVAAMEAAITALRMGSTDSSMVQQAAAGLAERTDDERRSWLLALLERRAAIDPKDWNQEHLLQNTLVQLGQNELALQRAKVHADAHPNNFPVWTRLLDMASEQGQSFGDTEFDRALGQVERLEPAHALARTLRRAAGQPVGADAFFESFAPDQAYAWQISEDLEKASTVEVLDSGLVYLYPDGSRISRNHGVTKAVDRSGTETLHSIPASGSPLIARVRKQDGTYREPVLVEEAWVMPNLDPGDAVELMFEYQSEEQWGAPVDLGPWRFASVQRPFGLSRYVVYIPDGMPVELRSANFVGTHVTESWGGGTVHVVTIERSPRVEQEVLMPSDLEIMPVARFAQDRGLGPIEQRWRQIFLEAQDLPFEVQEGLNAWVRDLDPEAKPEEKARVLFEQLANYLVEFDGSPSPAAVWFTKRGQPILLYSVLLQAAEIPFAWAVLETGVAPELNPNPVKLFENLEGFSDIVLRIQGEEKVLWQVPPNTKGTVFGKLPNALAGARVLVLEPTGTRFESLPRDILQGIWDNQISLHWTVQEDGSATVEGVWAITSLQGSTLINQLSQASSTQRDGFVRQYLPNLVPGIDLKDYEIVDLQKSGADFRLRFTGSRPDFVDRSGGGQRVDLRLPETGLSKGLGPSQRQWPLAARISRREQIQVRVTLPEGMQITGGPTGFEELREGFQHRLFLETEGQDWVLERTFIMRGLFLEADQVPTFLEKAAELEREESRPLVLSGPAEDPKEEPAEESDPEKEGSKSDPASKESEGQAKEVSDDDS